MSLSAFELRVEPIGEVEFPTVHVFIGGQDLVELVRTVELPLARAEGHEDLAGGYAGLEPQAWADLPEQYEGRAAVLGCECGEVGCWPLRVRITFDESVVVWSDFEQPHRAWSYEGLGPFRFDRHQYEEQIARIIDAAA